jgi:hypothetical protein
VTDETSIQEQDRTRWRLCLEKFLKHPKEPILIIELRRQWNSSARPVLARGIDKYEYVVKGCQAGRQIIIDQIVARLGFAMGAPVGKPQVVEISDELIELNPKFSFLASGKAHATYFIPNCFDDRDASKYKDHSGNRERFALLCALYGWAYSQDEQFIYRKTHPCLVYSVDHGRFFPGGYAWTAETLQNAPEANVHRKLALSCNLTNNEIRQALFVLRGVTEETIIEAVATPPDEWGITMDERMVMLEFLIKRQQSLLEFL